MRRGLRQASSALVAYASTTLTRAWASCPLAISDNGQNVAAGSFDFSNSPLYLPRSDSESASTIRYEFGYPLGSFWRLPNSLGESGEGSSSTRVTPCRTHLVDCVDEGLSSGPIEGDMPDTNSIKRIPSSGEARPATGDSESASFDALRAQADADRPRVTSDLADRWVPQLSAKQPGLVAADVDGRMVTWSNQETLRHHLALRMTYPEVRLLWSDEWRTFDLRGWWVTVAGVTHSEPTGANSWCDSKAIAVDQCFAKLVSNARGPEGTTKYRG